MTDHDAAAQEIARKFTVIANHAEITLEGLISAALRAAEARGREQGIEEAAKVAEERSSAVERHAVNPWSIKQEAVVRDSAAAAIRDLLPPPPVPTGKREVCQCCAPGAIPCRTSSCSCPGCGAR